ncbi:MAG: 16S rRNA (cytosine(1402)-N(4))-methyltransferase RsmH [Acidobacteria bacterium]|nr:16S rRNA (cytosine(1402)-N(4))-methyltransferase RsmH [Acidobacteriota bacterium]
MNEPAVEGIVHDPVLLEETIRLLRALPGARIADCTVGGGGHARRILAAIGPEGSLLGIDRDPEAVERIRRDLPGSPGRIHWVASDFRRLPEVAAGLGWSRIDAVLADLGLSSLQLEDPGRGFSFRLDGPLDMRFDRSAGGTAEDLVNEAPEAEIRRILRVFGEEPLAPRIARRIVRERRRRRIRTTDQLVEIVESAAGGRPRRIHPATRTFQALRIVVNRELEGLDRFLEEAAGLLSPGGRIVVLSFHSLEDRVVKRTFARLASRCVCPPGLPVCGCGRPGILRTVTRRAVRPSPAEIDRNPRARSARLRAAERIEAAGGRRG